MSGPQANALAVRLEHGSYLGSAYHYEVVGGGTRFRVQTARAVEQAGAFVRIPPEAATLFARSVTAEDA